MVNDFLDNLGARQHRKMTEKNATKEEITNTCEETFGKKAATKKPTTIPKAKAKTSKTPSTRQKTTAPGKPKPRKKPEPKLKRKKLPPEEMHPFPTFPYRLEYQDGKDTRVCHFECEEHRDKHIKRYRLRKNQYFSDNAT